MDYGILAWSLDDSMDYLRRGEEIGKRMGKIMGERATGVRRRRLTLHCRAWAAWA